MPLGFPVWLTIHHYTIIYIFGERPAFVLTFEYKIPNKIVQITVKCLLNKVQIVDQWNANYEIA